MNNTTYNIFCFLKIKKMWIREAFRKKRYKVQKKVLNIFFFFDSLNENKIFFKSPDYLKKFFFSNIYVDIIIEF